MKKEDLVKEVCKFHIDGIARKRKKDLHAKLLGQFLYLIYPKYDEFIDDVIQRIKGPIYKAKMLGAYMALHIEDETKTEELINEIVTQPGYGQSDTNLAITNIYLEIEQSTARYVIKTRYLDIESIVSLMVTASNYAKIIDDRIDRILAADKIVRTISSTGRLDKIPHFVQLLQHLEFDDITKELYKLNDHPERIEMYVKLYGEEACKEQSYRASLDWFLWAHLERGVPSMVTETELYFEYILNISRCSDYNIGIKNDYLDEYFEYVSSLSKETKEDLVITLKKLNDGFKQSDKWKNRIDARLKKI